MYIAPNTQIYVLAAVPLDSTYEHTIWWANANAQYTYMRGKAKWGFDQQSYQRVRRGFIRVNKVADDLYDCNYVMFQNTNFGNKWFYAFIKSVEYINNEVSEIEFVIDVMQTWSFDYTIMQCFVEREHTADDVLFGHIGSENLEIGDEYTCNAVDEFDMSAMSICVLINKNTESGGQSTGRFVNGMYTPLSVVAGIPATAVSAIDAVLNQYLEDEIVAVYEYPSIFGDASTSSAYSGNKTINLYTGALNGYTPRNRKLYCYPYNFLLVSNNSGQIAEYHWEDFSGTPSFIIRGVFVSTPSAFCYPSHYRGMTAAYDDGIVLSNFPQCAWSGDTFKAWWAQNKASFVTSGISTVLSGIATGVGAGVLTGNPIVGIGTGLTTAGGDIAAKMAQVHDIKSTPNQTHGQTQTDSLNASIGRVQFNFYSMSIKAEYAEMIDNYFDRYGYICHKIKVPNHNVRPHWTYTKTIGCTIRGSIPVDDMNLICKIYDNGITFWNNPDEIGNYSLDNRV